MADFEILEHTADVGIVAHGQTLEQAFANCARAMFSLMTDLEAVEEWTSREVEVTASDRELLLAEWLSELLYLFEVEHLLLRRFEVQSLDEGRLRARVWGERIDPSRHLIHMGIKAVTHHMLEVRREDGYQATVIFDI